MFIEIGETPKLKRNVGYHFNKKKKIIMLQNYHPIKITLLCHKHKQQLCILLLLLLLLFVQN